MVDNNNSGSTANSGSNSDKDKKFAKVTIPKCEDNVYDYVIQLFAMFNNDSYEIYDLKMTLSTGTNIEYCKKKRTYSLSNGQISKKSWASSENHALFVDNFNADINSIVFPNISISDKGKSYCDKKVEAPVITWDGDFIMNVLGDSTINATGSNTIFGGKKSVIGGGTRGIKVDSFGSASIKLDE